MYDENHIWQKTEEHTKSLKASYFYFKNLKRTDVFCVLGVGRRHEKGATPSSDMLRVRSANYQK